MSAGSVKHALQSSAGQIKQFKKYTVQPTGIWARISNFLAVDPKRSTGVPLNPQYRLPTPGAQDPNGYDDPVTVPAGDLAENPYWKRDMRRRYMQPSTIKQSDVVGLLSVGSRANEKVELIGEAGQKQLVAVQDEGEKGLAAFFQKDKNLASGVLDKSGLPPLPSGLYEGSQSGQKKYELLSEEEQTYGPKYPCRTFI
ncbi:uncharacterized protein K452DRAFT_287083 [Aplosporella prunicola CBS 121167]|uniref:NADH-ubiquinone oxidoreductase 21.3 kDa subunit n=1 Tax=Aplosporella prunicola CBS 121167 TaxID=1176127 RepID=A0A6A6BGW8_9PEZI|nr:uncharacterized protein K452DRAFT_287083 [Aplosporella prunicola CBS 121167]KAF2142673.1 hypothetical protein K452DRAFT_287083 [Aplosporella prunicola CBS 121167]